MGTYGNLWELSAWELMGTYGNLWELMGTYGNLWELRAEELLLRIYGVTPPHEVPISSHKFP